MKKVILFLGLILAFSFSAQAQTTDSRAGANNGCNDGKNTAHLSISEADAVVQTIMSNPSISNEYKQAYYDNFYKCRSQKLNGSGGNGSASTCIAWSWKDLKFKKVDCPIKGGYEIEWPDYDETEEENQ